MKCFSVLQQPGQEQSCEHTLFDLKNTISKYFFLFTQTLTKSVESFTVKMIVILFRVLHPLYYLLLTLFIILSLCCLIWPSLTAHLLLSELKHKGLCLIPAHQFEVLHSPVWLVLLSQKILLDRAVFKGYYSLSLLINYSYIHPSVDAWGRASKLAASKGLNKQLTV